MNSTSNSEYRSDDVCGDAIAERVEANTLVLDRLVLEISQLREVTAQIHLQEQRPDESAGMADPNVPDDPSRPWDDRDRWRDRHDELESEVAELRRQNEELASRLASSDVRRALSSDGSGCDDALSWEDRKQAMLQQMEDDTFCAESFIASLTKESPSTAQACEGSEPVDIVRGLWSEIDQRDEQLKRRDEEIRELRCLLDQQSETHGGVAIGAASIAEMIDSDELVREERERLQLMQDEWEEKFRQAEIDASLERAKLSRERQELAKKQAELEIQIEHLRRESRRAKKSDVGHSRRWLVELGLHEPNPPADQDA